MKDWEYVLHDYLETDWKLGADAVGDILQLLRREQIRASQVKPLRCIKVQSHLIFLEPYSALTHIWLYDAANKEMKKVVLTGRRPVTRGVRTG